MIKFKDISEGQQFTVPRLNPDAVFVKRGDDGYFPDWDLTVPFGADAPCELSPAAERKGDSK